MNQGVPRWKKFNEKGKALQNGKGKRIRCSLSFLITKKNTSEERPGEEKNQRGGGGCS